MAEHYFSKEQASELRLRKIKANLRGFSLYLYSGSGVFSPKKVDFGTKLLVGKMAVGSKDDVLDLGCGIGVVGLVASYLTKGNVVMVDVNERACDLARMNMKSRKNAKVLCGDAYEPVKNKKFDVILLNPPQAAGRKLCFRMIIEAEEHLKKDGSLQIVARHNKGGKVLSEKMAEVFGNLETVAKKGGYRIYFSRLKDL